MLQANHESQMEGDRLRKPIWFERLATDALRLSRAHGVRITHVNISSRREVARIPPSRRVSLRQLVYAGYLRVICPFSHEQYLLQSNVLVYLI